MTSQNQPPVAEVRDGTLKITLWERSYTKDGQHRTFITANPSCGYKDDQGNWQDGNSYSADELLRMANLFTEAYNKVRDLKRSASADQQQEAA